MPKQPQQNQDPCTTGGTGGVVTEIDKVRSSTSSAASSTCPGGGGGFTPPVSGEINFSPFDFSNSGSSTISADLVSSLIGSAGTGAGAGSDATSPLGPDYSGGTNGPSEGLAGDIIIKGNAVTAILNNRDSAKKTELAAFYGLDSIQGEASTLIGALCKIRPWAINFLSTFASANVFDSICTFRGYKPPPPPPTPVKKAAAKAATKAATSTTSTPKVPAQADIWAVPASVISGGRTSIFWSAKGVDTCEETSSDKTFSRATLSGSSPTSPLTSAVTFTISCTSAAGAHVVNAVTVTVR
ncbi:hypothetical protein HY968_03180 [Candidatus Kaiserbacteria bacterium]|nr:hypothetical protein [Candidatus Kaiserbacteria bacterium]